MSREYLADRQSPKAEYGFQRLQLQIARGNASKSPTRRKQDSQLAQLSAVSQASSESRQHSSQDEPRFAGTPQAGNGARVSGGGVVARESSGSSQQHAGDVKRSIQFPTVQGQLQVDFSAARVRGGTPSEPVLAKQGGLGAQRLSPEPRFESFQQRKGVRTSAEAAQKVQGSNSSPSSVLAVEQPGSAQTQGWTANWWSVESAKPEMNIRNESGEAPSENRARDSAPAETLGAQGWDDLDPFERQSREVILRAVRGIPELEMRYSRKFQLPREVAQREPEP